MGWISWKKVFKFIQEQRLVDHTQAIGPSSNLGEDVPHDTIKTNME